MNEKFLEVGDVMHILGISKSAAYKLMRQINSELEKKREKSHGGGKCHQNGKVVAENATKTVK